MRKNFGGHLGEVRSSRGKPEHWTMRSEKPFLSAYGHSPYEAAPRFAEQQVRSWRSERAQEASMGKCAMEETWVARTARNTEALVRNAQGRSPRLRRIWTSC